MVKESVTLQHTWCTACFTVLYTKVIFTSPTYIVILDMKRPTN